MERILRWFVGGKFIDGRRFIQSRFCAFEIVLQREKGERDDNLILKAQKVLRLFGNKFEMFKCINLAYYNSIRIVWNQLFA